MATLQPYPKNKYTRWIYGILIIVSASAAILAVINIKISPDSMRFGLVSQQILAGNGIRVPIIRLGLEDNYVPVNGAIPFLDQMPLLPILFALFGGITPQNYSPAQLLNVISHIATSIFTFLLMKRLYDNNGIALLAGTLVSFSYPLLWNTNHILSEPLFIVFITATIYFLILSRKPDHSSFSRNLFIASICACAAILTRNAGTALIPVFIWEVFIAAKNKRLQSNKFISTVLALLLPIITMSVMFVRNYMISGNIRGFSYPSPERSYTDAFKGTFEIIFSQFQLGTRPALIIISFLLLLTIFSIINARMRIELSNYFRSGLDLIAVFVISYTGLVYITMKFSQPRFEVRYASPLVPFLFIISIFLIVFIRERLQQYNYSKIANVWLMLFLSILILGNTYKSVLNLPEFFYKQEKAYQIQDFCTYKWVTQNLKKGSVITTNRPYHLSFFGGYSTIALPHKRFDPNILVPEDMGMTLPDRMSKFGARILVLFDETLEEYDGNYITKLFNKRQNDDNFTLAYECSDGVVYQLKE